MNKTVWDISNDLTIGETVTFSGLLSKSAPGNYNTLDFYANGTFVGTVVDDAGFSSIGGVGFRTVNLDSGDTIIIDNLRFGTALNSNAEVIPEPSTYALIFGGLVLGVVIFRRKLGKREALETAA
ncbi:MAG: PEP-CTERM sorting domain-containing protein [Verrucomicrobiae bacterium]|nr:PEP-CTERM sorting domain-containing protein [Verrucomicrobiae bacterium]